MYICIYVSNRRMRARAGTAPQVVGAAAAARVAAVLAVAATGVSKKHGKITKKNMQIWSRSHPGAAPGRPGSLGTEPGVSRAPAGCAGPVWAYALARICRNCTKLI